jgi:hypothetical protein
MNIKNWKVFFIGIVLASSTTVAFADDDHEYGIVYKFDLDHDGMITRAEYDMAFEQKMKFKLAWLDINKDGVISPEEFIGRHRDEFDQRWKTWDTNNDDIISVDVVLKQKQEERVDKKGEK